ncbi:MAG: hypothetical protein FWB99_05115 [Treponema sp.]|nr:hypothetical protein [Treponema sp.]
MRKGTIFILLLFAALLLSSCGLMEGEPFIEPVPQADIERFSNNRAIVNLRHYPALSAQPAFSHFAIFYRIYVSNIPEFSPSPATFNAINPTLHSNYNTIRPFIDSDSLFGANMHDQFRRLGFWYLALEGNANINAILNNAIGNIVEFNFPSGENPFIRIGPGNIYDTAGNITNVHTLWRSNDGGRFTPVPENRFFRNTDDLRNPEHIIPQRNADVANIAGERQYTYAAMFIVAVGMNSSTFATVHSTPSLIHVFQLPD